MAFFNDVFLIHVMDCNKLQAISISLKEICCVERMNLHNVSTYTYRDENFVKRDKLEPLKQICFIMFYLFTNYVNLKFPQNRSRVSKEHILIKIIVSIAIDITWA